MPNANQQGLDEIKEDLKALIERIEIALKEFIDKIEAWFDEIRDRPEEPQPKPTDVK